MKQIKQYKNLISEIPVLNQSTIIKRKIWEKFLHTTLRNFEHAIFENNDEIELSRDDIISEPNIKKKIIMTLMWGYPTGGRGNNIKNILGEIDKLSTLLSPINNQDLSKSYSNLLFKKFASIHGLGISTWSKFLFFFNVSIDSNKCQIYDLKIVDSLNKKQFTELSENNAKWKQDIKHYYKYIELLNYLARTMNVRPEKVEIFLFYYNLYYKF